MVRFSMLRMFEYMLQSCESSWAFRSTLWTILNLLLVNVKRFSAEQIKNEIKRFDFGSIKRALRSHFRTITAGKISIYRFASTYGKT